MKLIRLLLIVLCLLFAMLMAVMPSEDEVVEADFSTSVQGALGALQKSESLAEPKSVEMVLEMEHLWLPFLPKG